MQVWVCIAKVARDVSGRRAQVVLAQISDVSVCALIVTPEHPWL